MPRHRGSAFGCCCVLTLPGCGQFFDSGSHYQDPVLQHTFAVSSAFSASGAMGDGEDKHLLAIFPKEGSEDACTGYIKRMRDTAGNRPQGNCYRFEYNTNGIDNWAGVYWQSPANNWGQLRGQPIAPSRFDRLRFKVALMKTAADGSLEPAASRMTFWAGGIGHGPSAAALAAQAAGEAAAIDAGIAPVDAGRPSLTTLYYKDAFKTAELVRAVLPDAVTGDAKWNEFSLRIPLTTTLPNDPRDPLRSNEPAFGKPYQRVIGAFAWALGHPAGTLPGTAEKFLIFIDDLVWEEAE
ncbi:MAG TPA: hypothetical protein VL137_18685 [Polyangiaceae bacterium]|nr:hypothetical protein [Polyangiaceae bacterium]